jgi:hypothetical protein
MKQNLIFVLAGVASAILFLLQAAPLYPQGSSVLVLCDGETFDGYQKQPFVLKSDVDRDPTVQKVIRNCVFRNSDLPGIAIWDAQNVLIEGNTFENIRTHVRGKGVHAINISCPDHCSIDHVIIRRNVFRFIGADGIQLGDTGRNIRHVRIKRNEFIGGEDVGENGVDIKGVEGPIRVVANTMHGFRPCENNQDCSGSTGVAMVIHDGDPSGMPQNVIVKKNQFFDNIYGLTVTDGAQAILVRGNNFSENSSIGLLVNDAYSIRIQDNTFSNNPKQLRVQDTPRRGGSCTRSGNLFFGGGQDVDLKNSICPSP